MTNTTVNVKVLFFAKARELVSAEEESVIIESKMTASNLKVTVLEKFPALEPIQKSIILALNQEYLNEDENAITLKDGDEIAIIPPLSGG